jgi:hypothetical protein
MSRAASILLLALLAWFPHIAHAAVYDGTWSVLVITDRGTCDRAYRYTVGINGGKVRFRGTDQVNLSGRVDRAGRVQVAISRGSQSAIGTGRLSADTGTGTWRGRSGGQQCSGRWEAERR